MQGIYPDNNVPMGNILPLALNMTSLAVYDDNWVVWWCHQVFSKHPTTDYDSISFAPMPLLLLDRLPNT